MAELVWFEATPPRDVDLAAVTNVIRPLANRARYGLPATTPLVVFELWGIAGQVRWQVGLDVRLGGDVPARLKAHLPGLGLRQLRLMERPDLSVGARVRMDRLSMPLRLDTAGAVSTELFSVLGGLRQDEVGVVQWVLGPSEPRSAAPVRFDLAESLGIRTPRPVDGAAARLWRQKAAEPLFGVQGRVGAQASTTAFACRTVRSLGSALKLASSEHAALRLGKTGRGQAQRLVDVSRPPLSWSCLLSASELAALVGWPVQDVVGDDLPTVGGYISPVPERLLAGPDQVRERVLGESLHPTQRGELVRVPIETSLHHLHVIGPTGSGKSTLLCGLIAADISAGHSVLVVEPKGDLVDDVLARMPGDQRDRVVVIDPSNADRVVGLNALAGPREQAERRADQIVDLLASMHGPAWGPRTADVALHALLTVSRLPGGTLPDVPVLLTNPAFRRRVLAQVNDPLVLGPWWAWYDGLSDGERGQVIAPLLNKLRAFLSRDALRRMLGQAEPRFRLEEPFVTPGRIVLVNLNKGLLGGPTASLLGALLLTQVWSAIQRRSRLPAHKRHPVMMVVDEFQDYVHLSGGFDFGDALAQSRGMGVGWALAHQHLDQLPASLRAATLANARSRVTFRPAAKDAKDLAASFGTGLTGEDLLRLRAFEACAQILVGGQPTVPFSVRTHQLPPWRTSPTELRQASAERYGTDGKAVDAALIERWHGGGRPEGPIGERPRRAS